MFGEIIDHKFADGDSRTPLALRRRFSAKLNEMESRESRRERRGRRCAGDESTRESEKRNVFRSFFAPRSERVTF